MDINSGHISFSELTHFILTNIVMYMTMTLGL